MLLGISETLRQYLVGEIPDTPVQIGRVTDLSAKSSEQALILVLYEIEDAGDFRTAPARLAPESQEPVALRLHYLVTSHAQDAGESQHCLSQVLEAFHNHPVFTEGELHATIADRVGRLTVQLRSGLLADLPNLWTAFGTAMQLSLYYEVNAQPPP
jgi:Pvc16 N-terminal domain